jgi:GNAT superfamily N-acetyltransferase
MAARESLSIRSAPEISIEAMTEHDLLEVCQIEELGQLSAWGWDAYHKELQSPQDTIMLVARVDSVAYGFELGGFIVARLIAGELHVNNVAVRPELRRNRIGSRLLERALQVAQRYGAKRGAPGSSSRKRSRPKTLCALRFSRDRTPPKLLSLTD